VRIAIALHVLAAVIWVGGMMFAHFALRPSVQSLPPQQRLALLRAVLGRFLALAGAAVAVIVVTGFWLIHAAGGLAAMPPSVHAMTALGALMALIYVFVVAVPYRRLRAAVAAADWAAAGAAMARLRLLIAVNLALGVAVVLIAVALRG
jgi:uncharacterized membrane protein